MTNETHEKILQEMTGPDVISTTAIIIERALNDGVLLTRGMLRDLLIDNMPDTDFWYRLTLEDMSEIIADTLKVRPDLARRLQPR